MNQCTTFAIEKFLRVITKREAIEKRCVLPELVPPDHVDEEVG
jgi:hypothetical protein